MEIHGTFKSVLYFLLKMMQSEVDDSVGRALN